MFKDLKKLDVENKGFYSKLNTQSSMLECSKLKTQNSKLKGQSIAELAIFGSILIFAFALFLQYGMSSKYQQRVMMEGFRQAFMRAKTAEISGKDGYHQVRYTLIKDKPIPDPANLYGISERRPVSSSVSAVWSQDLFVEADGLETELPRIDYEINNEIKSYTTASWQWKEFDSSMRKRENKADWDGQGVFWYWKPVEMAEVEKGDFLDIDGDGVEESVIQVVIDEEEDEEGEMTVVGGRALVLDRRAGEIDVSGVTEEAGGLSRNYDIVRKILSPSSFRRQENHAQITTTTKVNFEEKFTRYIKRRATDVEPIDTIESTFVTEESETWTTPF